MFCERYLKRHWVVSQCEQQIISDIKMLKMSADNLDGEDLAKKEIRDKHKRIIFIFIN